MFCVFFCLLKPSVLFRLLISAEHSNGCQNIVEFDMVTPLESQARGCQFTERVKGGKLSASFEGLSV